LPRSARPAYILHRIGVIESLGETNGPRAAEPLAVEAHLAELLVIRHDVVARHGGVIKPACPVVKDVDFKV
jgi:hypothetical protein